MSIQQITTCDQCGADITEGTGRQWRLMVMSEVIGMKPGAPARVDAGLVLPQQHFCDEKCVAGWATAQAAVKDQAQADFEAKQKADAVAEKSPPAMIAT